LLPSFTTRNDIHLRLGVENYRHSGSLKHRSMSKAYNAITDTTPNTMMYSIFVYLFIVLASCASARRGVTQFGQG
jgi:hypothetical protein